MKSETLEETKKINRGADNEMIEDRDGEKTEKQDDGFNLKTEIFSWILTIGAAFLSALLIGGFIIFYAYVPSGSMENTLHAGNRLIGFRLAYINKDPQRGDIITFRYPLDESEIFIKRVIGLPGETLDIRDSHVYINGSETPLKEEYLKEEWEVANNELHYEIPEDCFFVMGDNRNNSADGRYWAEEA
ncbi:MAG: signal peptidase I, partial [Lachnospiraceae bacterium]|nr:signal peptidase I [Lachnospiraceae bacterium]